jgi:hypothetical protein
LSENKLLNSALYYQGKGYSVIPCEPKGKKPLVRWEMYQTVRPDEKRIEKWWTQHPNANIGIITGKISGILVLDYDGNEGDATLNSQLPEIEPTAMASTGNGGHYYFQYPEDDDGWPRRFQNFAKKLPGLDFRGDGGYVIAPPSLHPNGTQYKWKFLKNLAPTPDWLISLIEKKQNGKAADTEPPGNDKVKQGERNVHFTSLAGAMRRKGLNQSAILEAMKEENKVKCDPPLSEFELKNIARSVCRYAPSEGYKKPSLPVPVSMADVQKTTVDWLWWPYIPYGFVCALEGDPGEGKSYISCAIATALSLGHGLPGVSDNGMETGDTILLTAEDHLGATVKKRLEDMQADMTRIYAIDEKFPLDGPGFAHIESMIQSFNTKLIVIDPIIAFLPAKMDMHRANEVRQVLSRLSNIAETYKCSILIIRHLSKSGQNKAIYRGQGSIDFTAACRSVLLAGHSPDDFHNKGISHIKCNLGPIGESLGYKIERGVFAWAGTSTITSNEILGTEEDSSMVGEAKDFLVDLLQDGPVLSKTVMAKTKESGLSPMSVRRAQKALNIKPQKMGGFGMEGGWSWQLPR